MKTIPGTDKEIDADGSHADYPGPTGPASPADESTYVCPECGWYIGDIHDGFIKFCPSCNYDIWQVINCYYMDGPCKPESCPSYERCELKKKDWNGLCSWDCITPCTETECPNYDHCRMSKATYWSAPSRPDGEMWEKTHCWVCDLSCDKETCTKIFDLDGCPVSMEPKNNSAKVNEVISEYLKEG